MAAFVAKKASVFLVPAFWSYTGAHSCSLQTDRALSIFVRQHISVPPTAAVTVPPLQYPSFDGTSKYVNLHFVLKRRVHRDTVNVKKMSLQEMTEAQVER